MLPSSLRGRLIIAFLVVAAAAIGTVGIAVVLVGPSYFAEAMGHAPGDPMGEAMAEATQVAFDTAMRNALVAATIAAVLTAGVTGLLVAARIARPISRLARAADLVAGGRYQERVPVDEPGELGELAVSFNEMATSLEATERRRLQLVGDVAHELRTPITTLDGYLEGLEDGVVEPSPETWAMLRAETGRMTRMVSDLAELWRAEARQLPLNPESFDADEVVRAVVARFEPQASARGVQLRVASGAGGEAAPAVPPAPAAPVMVRADRDRLAQVLANYLSNALRHAPDGTAIVTTTQRRGSAVRISVADSGPGLAADQLEAVFERFYRVDAARSRAAGGSGIGLAIVRALAEAMDGQAWAESAGQGMGATFHVELPAA